jgi:hypothetical protein
MTFGKDDQTYDREGCNPFFDKGFSRWRKRKGETIDFP